MVSPALLKNLMLGLSKYEVSPSSFDKLRMRAFGRRLRLTGKLIYSFVGFGASP